VGFDIVNYFKRTPKCRRPVVEGNRTFHFVAHTSSSTSWSNRTKATVQTVCYSSVIFAEGRLEVYIENRMDLRPYRKTSVGRGTWDVECS